MRTYNIERKYTKNTEGFIMMVLGCIYEEIKFLVAEKKNSKKEKDLTYIHELRMAADAVMHSYRTIFRLQHNPVEFVNHFDGLEILEWATWGVNLQKNVDELMTFLKEPITINVMGGFPPEMDNMLPKFGDKVTFTQSAK